MSNTCDNDFGGWGATALNALSTAIMMEKEDVVVQILRFIPTLDFTKVEGGSKIQLFEVATRHLGGMIPAYDLLTGPYSHLATDPQLLNSLHSQMVALGMSSSAALTPRAESHVPGLIQRNATRTLAHPTQSLVQAP